MNSTDPSKGVRRRRAAGVACDFFGVSPSHSGVTLTPFWYYVGVAGLTLRLPEDLHEALRVAARSSGRSLNSEIVWRLRGSWNGVPAEVVPRPAVDVPPADADRVAPGTDPSAATEAGMGPVSRALARRGS